MVSFGGALLGALAFATTALAQTTSTPVSRYCSTSNGDVCGSINVPDSGSDLFFQVKGSTDPGWVAVGVGSGMAGALIFVIYPSADGKNVTVSPRLGTGHSEPQYDSSITITRLDGSGVSGSTMTANFMCANCRSWGSSGSINVDSTSQNFIWAAGPGTAIDSDDVQESISQHSDHGNFQLDVVSATGGNGSTNPFTASANGTSNTSSGGSSVSVGLRKSDKVLIAHGVIMAVTWVLLFPLGAAFIRLLSNHLSNAVAMHRGLQIFNVCLAIIGLAMGMWKSGLDGTNFTSFHQYFGVILVGMLFVQAALGHLHHAEYQRIQKRSGWSYAHIWMGRIVIALAIINGGIGLGPDMAGASAGQIAAYSIVAILVVGVYFTFYFFKSRAPPKNYDIDDSPRERRDRRGHRDHRESTRSRDRRDRDRRA